MYSVTEYVTQLYTYVISSLSALKPVAHTHTNLWEIPDRCVPRMGKNVFFFLFLEE